MDQVSGKRVRKGPRSPPTPQPDAEASRGWFEPLHRFHVVALTDEVPGGSTLDQLAGMALARLGQPAALDAAERESLAALLGWCRSRLAEVRDEPASGDRRFSLNPIGQELFGELISLIRLQDAQIAELQAIISETL